MASPKTLHANPMQVQTQGTAASWAPTFSVNVSKKLSDIGGQAIQQDSGLHFTITDQRGCTCHVVIICDGHGHAGENISNMATTTFYHEMSSSGFYDRFKENPTETAILMFKTAQENVFRYMVEYIEQRELEYEIRDGHIYSSSMILKGGTTATVVLADEEGTVFTMNVADSEAWMIQGLNAIQLTADHLPDTLSEYERIQAIYPSTKHLYDRRSYMKAHTRGDDVFPITEQKGYYIKNVNGDWATVLVITEGSSASLKLAFTRSIGDENLRKGGVIETPSVSSHMATESAVILVASDGFWDNIKTSEIVAKTQADGEMCSYNSESMGQQWFKRISAENYTNFGHGRDNMMGYLITMKKI
jgi:serine/threonine protein phosphatase PrpC